MRKSDDHSMKALLKTKSQLISCVVAVIVAAIFIPFTLATIQWVTYAKAHCPPSYTWPSFKDFWFTGITAVVSYGLEELTITIFYPWYYKICKEKKDEAARKRRTTKAVNNIFKCAYYFTSWLIGHYLIKDSFIYPASLGGKGDLYNLF